MKRNNDKYVVLGNVKLFEDRLGAETSVLHDKGHLGSGDNVPEVLEILDAIKRLDIHENFYVKTRA